MIYEGDALEVMAQLQAGSVAAVVTDPPYGLEFMGKEWDRLGARFRDITARDAEVGGLRERLRARLPEKYATSAESQLWHQVWAEAALRVAAPGAYLLAFGGTRTYHRLASAVEDAGWQIRDCLVWAYATGFPKSRAHLKPAWEPIVLARAPGPLRPLDIDGCRIEGPAGAGVWGTSNETVDRAMYRAATPAAAEYRSAEHPAGRWPSNVLLTDPIFDGDTPGVVGGGLVAGAPAIERPEGFTRFDGTTYSGGAEYVTGAYESPGYDDDGTYSRFYLIPKAARSEREPTFGALELVTAPNGDKWTDNDRRSGRPRNPRTRIAQRRNVHPTVKPVDLMRHLVRLVTPAGGTVLDPFLGSGTTAIAAEMEGRRWIGIERNAEYVAIAQARLMGVQQGFGL